MDQLSANMPLVSVSTPWLQGVDMVPGNACVQFQPDTDGTSPIGITKTGVPPNFITWNVTVRRTVVVQPEHLPRTSDSTIMWTGPSIVNGDGLLVRPAAVTLMLLGPIAVVAATLTAES